MNGFRVSRNKQRHIPRTLVGVVPLEMRNVRRRDETGSREGDVRSMVVVISVAATWTMSGCAIGVTTEYDDDDFQSNADDGTGGNTSGQGGATATAGVGGATASTASATTAANTTATTVATTAASTGSGGSSCDLQGDCMACSNCATQNDCAPDVNACFNDTACSALVDCFNACTDDPCMNTCADQHQGGMNLYMAVSECAFCTACPSDCVNEGQGLCF